MDQILPSLVALVTTLATIAGGYFLTRRYRKMGIGPAEQVLSATLQSTMQAQATEIASLGRQVKDLTSRVLHLEQVNAQLTADNQALRDDNYRLLREARSAR